MKSLKYEIEKKHEEFYNFKLGKTRRPPTYFLLTPDHSLDSLVPLSVPFLKAHAYYIISSYTEVTEPDLARDFFEKAYKGENISPSFYRKVKQDFTGNLKGVI